MAKIEFTPATQQTIRTCSQWAAQDLSYAHASDAGFVAQTTLDAGFMSRLGYSDADAEVKALVIEHGWTPVAKAAERIVCTG